VTPRNLIYLIALDGPRDIYLTKTLVLVKYSRFIHILIFRYFLFIGKLWFEYNSCYRKSLFGFLN
jgi:hypothetical protein